MKQNEMLKGIIEWVEKYGKSPTVAQWTRGRNSKYPSYKTYANYFGTWNVAIKAAGFETNKAGIEKEYTDEELLESLRKWKKLNERLPESRDFTDNSYPSNTAIVYRFGSWNKAIELAGLESQKGGCHYKTYSDKDLLDYLRQFKLENKRPPFANEFHNPRYPSYVIYLMRFGSWNKALEMAGLIPNNTSQFKGRQGELQTIQEFKTEGAIDLSGENRHSTCDGICPKGEMFDTKSASIIKHNHRWCWTFQLNGNQLEEVDYLFLRAYEDKDFTKPPLHKWRVPIKFMKNRRAIFVYKDECGEYNVKNMKKYEIGSNENSRS